MKGSNYAFRVGLFVLIGITAIGGLLLIFSKGLFLFSSTYELVLRANSAGGLKGRSAVLMSGVSIGTVGPINVGPGGKGVRITLIIQSQHQIHSDARFVIEQIGFLGDQYVAVYPQENKAAILQPGQEVQADEPLNIEKALRSATDLLARLGGTVSKLDTAIDRINNSILSETTLTNVSIALVNTRTLTDRAVGMIDNINRLVETNSNPIFHSVSNLQVFSDGLAGLTDELREVVITNGFELNKAVKSLENTSQSLERLAAGVESGKGLAGALFRDDQLRGNLFRTIENLANVSSNINKYGILYKPKRPKAEIQSPAVPPKNPFGN